MLPNRDMVFDFALVSGREGKMEANDLNLVANYSPHARGPQPPFWQPVGSGDNRSPRIVARPVIDVAEPSRADGNERTGTSPMRIGDAPPLEPEPAEEDKETPVPAQSSELEESSPPDMEESELRFPESSVAAEE